MSVEEPRRDTAGSSEEEQQRARLTEQAAALRRQIDERSLKEEDLRADCLLDAADVSSTAEALEQHRRQTENERELLARVESALARLDDGSFGHCVRCGRAIDPERLRALPHLEHCLSCRTELENAR